MRLAGTPDWMSVVCDLGYYDQAHLIHEFREFAADSPGALIERGFVDLNRFPDHLVPA